MQKSPRCERLKLKVVLAKDKSTRTHTTINNRSDISLIISSPWETSQQMHNLTMFLSVKIFLPVKVRFFILGELPDFEIILLFNNNRSDV